MTFNMKLKWKKRNTELAAFDWTCSTIIPAISEFQLSNDIGTQTKTSKLRVFTLKMKAKLLKEKKPSRAIWLQILYLVF